MDYWSVEGFLQQKQQCSLQLKSDFAVNEEMFLCSYYPDHISKVNDIYSLLYSLFIFSMEFIIYMQNVFATIDAVNILYVSAVTCLVFSLSF